MYQIAKKERKNPADTSAGQIGLKLRLTLHAGEAVAAIDGTIRLGLEGNLRLAAAGSTGSGEILSGAAGSVLARVTAGLAALGLVLEATLRVEFLLTGGEHKFSATFLAY